MKEQEKDRTQCEGEVQSINKEKDTACYFEFHTISTLNALTKMKKRKNTFFWNLIIQGNGKLLGQKFKLLRLYREITKRWGRQKRKACRRVFICSFIKCFSNREQYKTVQNNFFPQLPLEGLVPIRRFAPCHIDSIFLERFYCCGIIKTWP